MGNYVAYDSHNDQMEEFSTLDEAKAFLTTDQDFSDGIPEDFEMGCCWIAMITHRTAVKQTDAKSDYDNPEDWPYSAEWEYVGDVILTETETTDCPACNRWRNEFGGSARYCPNCGKRLEMV